MNARFQFVPLRAQLACLGLLILSGCWRGDGINVAPVTGTVTWNGKPLPNAEVYFIPEQGRLSYGRTNSEGVYELLYSGSEKGAIVGMHRVRIRGAYEGDGTQQGVKEFLPKKYHDETILTAKVEPQQNVVNFDLLKD